MTPQPLSIVEEAEIIEEMVSAFGLEAGAPLYELEVDAPQASPAFGPSAGDVLRPLRADDGETHAAYPDATRTLCSRLVVGLELVQGRAAAVPPGCPGCLGASRAHDKIDSSAPREWFRT